MKIQSVNRKICSFDLFSLALEIRTSPRQERTSEPNCNFYEENAELAEELSAPAPAGLTIQPPPEIHPDEFEARYKWFLA